MNGNSKSATILDMKLRTKILAVFALFALGMAAILATAGYVLIKQLDGIEGAVQQASQRVAASTTSQVAIIEMDRAIQALIAAVEADAALEAEGA
jgi:hypothetical protein